MATKQEDCEAPWGEVVKGNGDQVRCLTLHCVVRICWRGKRADIHHWALGSTQLLAWIHKVSLTQRLKNREENTGTFFFISVNNVKEPVLNLEWLQCHRGVKYYNSLRGMPNRITDNYNVPRLFPNSINLFIYLIQVFGWCTILNTAETLTYMCWCDAGTSVFV